MNNKKIKNPPLTHCHAGTGSISIPNFQQFEIHPIWEGKPSYCYIRNNILYHNRDDEFGFFSQSITTLEELSNFLLNKVKSDYIQSIHKPVITINKFSEKYPILELWYSSGTWIIYLYSVKKRIQKLKKIISISDDFADRLMVFYEQSTFFMDSCEAMADSYMEQYVSAKESYNEAISELAKIFLKPKSPKNASQSFIDTMICFTDEGDFGDIPD